jgi:hypothetical protein
VVLLLQKLDVIQWDFSDIFADYWPLILVFIGLGIIVSSLRRPGIDES